MNQKRFLGFTLILAGMLLSFSRVVLTGAVIGIEKSNLSGLIGSILVILGLIFALSKSKMRIV